MKSVLRCIHQGIKWTSSALDTSASVVTIISAIAFALLIFVAVLSRYVFHFSLIFSVEISKLLFVWSAFLAATIGFKRKSHIMFNIYLAIKGTYRL
jgi:TRAP-type C4-dicarboxylate transport system permease small subunit